MRTLRHTLELLSPALQPRTLARAMGSSLAVGYVIYLLMDAAYAPQSLTQAWAPGHLPWLALAGLLLPLNYLLESHKMQVLLGGRVPLHRSLRAVLAGHALGLLTPSRVGDYAGRALGLPRGERKGVLWATLLCRSGQLIITLAAGVLGVLWMMRAARGNETGLMLGAVLLASLILTGLVAILLRPSHNLRRLTDLLGRVAILRRLTALAEPFSDRQIALAWGLSILRYAVFATQFVFLLKAYHAAADPLALLSMVSIIFLLKSFLPAFALGELGVRESLTLAVAGWAGYATGAAFNAALMLTVLNLMLPAAAGGLWLLADSARRLRQ